jgi:hypothetical protein
LTVSVELSNDDNTDEKENKHEHSSLSIFFSLTANKNKRKKKTEHEIPPTHLFIHPTFGYSLHIDRVFQPFGRVFPAINSARRKEEEKKKRKYSTLCMH